MSKALVPPIRSVLIIMKLLWPIFGNDCPNDKKLNEDTKVKTSAIPKEVNTIERTSVKKSPFVKLKVLIFNTKKRLVFKMKRDSKMRRVNPVILEQILQTINVVIMVKRHWRPVLCWRCC